MNDNDRRPEIQESAQDMSEVLRIRREKLNTLMLEGKNPYLQTHYKTDISHRRYAMRLRRWKAKRFLLPAV